MQCVSFSLPPAEVVGAVVGAALMHACRRVGEVLVGTSYGGILAKGRSPLEGSSSFLSNTARFLLCGLRDSVAGPSSICDRRTVRDKRGVCERLLIKLGLGSFNTISSS